MSTTYSLKFARRAGVAGVAALAIAAGGIGFAANASVSGTSFVPYDESDSPNPVDVIGGLAYNMGADGAWFLGEPGVGVPIAEVASLAYTVADSTGYAPSYQLIVWADRMDKGAFATHKYTRLVWEPYMQDADLDPNSGVYTGVEDGLWWTSKIANPAPGSQSDPQPLSFFQDGAGAGWDNVDVFAFAVHQGTTTDTTSMVTSVSYNGSEVSIGKEDPTPFAQSDIDAAVAPVQDDLDVAVADLADANDHIDGLNDDITDLQAQLATANAALAAKQTELNTYVANHSNVNGTNIGASRVLLANTPIHGQVVRANLAGTISKAASSPKFQWYLDGKLVKGATASSYKVPASAKGKPVQVVVTGTSKNVVFSVTSNTVRAR